MISVTIKCFVLVFLVWTKAGPHPIPGVFPDKFDCQVTEGELAGILEKDPTVISWSIPTECVVVPLMKKS